MGDVGRFDSVYLTHFKTNLRRIVDYPNLWGYARDLYQHPAFHGTTNFDHMKRHYFTEPPIGGSLAVHGWEEPILALPSPAS